jgi:hypothetical protein
MFTKGFGFLWIKILPCKFQITEIILQNSKIDLNQFWGLFAKFTKEKQKRKSKRKEKGGKRPQEMIRPEARTGPRPSNAPPRNSTLSPLSLSLTMGPTHQSSSTSAKIFTGDRDARISSPIQFSVTPCLNRCLPTPINPPPSPLHFPPPSSLHYIARLLNLLAGARSCRRPHPTFSTATRYLLPSLLSQLTSLVLAHLVMLFFWSIPQRINVAVHSRSSLPLRNAPAATPRCSRTWTSALTTLSSSPRSPEHRLHLRCPWEPLEPRRRPLPSCSSSPASWNPSPTVRSSSPFYCTVRSRSRGLNQITYSTGMDRSSPSRSHKIQRLRLPIRSKWYQPTRAHHVAALCYLWFRIRF